MGWWYSVRSTPGFLGRACRSYYCGMLIGGGRSRSPNAITKLVPADGPATVECIISAVWAEELFPRCAVRQCRSVAASSSPGGSATKDASSLTLDAMATGSQGDGLGCSAARLEPAV